jgi:hypothetical protein
LANGENAITYEYFMDGVSQGIDVLIVDGSSGFYNLDVTGLTPAEYSIIIPSITICGVTVNFTENNSATWEVLAIP